MNLDSKRVMPRHPLQVPPRLDSEKASLMLSFRSATAPGFVTSTRASRNVIGFNFCIHQPSSQVLCYEFFTVLRNIISFLCQKSIKNPDFSFSYYLYIIIFKFFPLVFSNRYRAITSAYYRGAVGALLVYDVTRKVTFDGVERWLKELRDYTDHNTVIMLVGNKADLRHLRVVSTEDGKAFAERENTFFMETSALESMNVDNAFIEVLTQIFRVASRKALISSADATVLPKGHTISVSMADDVSAVKKVGCC
ncbi:ras-related protein RABA1f-like [Phalaenopsis equestris]|uniref:ras-related protein RABA1f-like n=1 Tax=Phalaenopsis equestris TaxID=78828 RepID=UPI0009E4525E|nr:ras-related protein RABA1f-like [Phalaenopsis equestris]